MELVIVIIALALIQYQVFGFLVGRARGKYDVPAPAMIGDPIFERYNRVHQNTQESLMLFIPGMMMFGYYINPTIAAGLGVIWLIGRILYLRSYVKEPTTRAVGFLLTFAPNVILVIGGAISAAMALF